jgi:hypothetical protein
LRTYPGSADRFAPPELSGTTQKAKASLSVENIDSRPIFQCAAVDLMRESGRNTGDWSARLHHASDAIEAMSEE